MWRSTVLFGTGIVLAVLGVIVWYQGNRPVPTQVSNEHTAPTSALEARLIAPLAETDEEVVTGAGKSVEFVYALHNAGTSHLENPRVLRLCGCKITRELPSRIAPGETAHFGFKLLAPHAGVHRQTLPIAANGANAPLIMLRPSLRTKLDAPRIVHYPPQVFLSAIRGEQPTSHEVLITTIEPTESDAFIAEIKCQPPGLVEINALDMREISDFDPQFVRRTYRFNVHPTFGGSVQESSAGVLFLKCRHESTENVPQIPLHLRLLEQVELVPQRLTLKAAADTQNFPKQVVVVRRGEERPEVLLKEYDQTLLQVELSSPPDAPVEMFSIVAQPQVSNRQTKVVFSVGDDGQDLVLPVELVADGHELVDNAADVSHESP